MSTVQAGGHRHRGGRGGVVHTGEYDAFISYSHESQEADVAAQLQRELERLGRPWHRLRRTVHVFRDETSLPLADNFPRELQESLRKCEWLILLVSPAASSSRWVNQEIRDWLVFKGKGRLIVILTSGLLAWSQGSNTFDECLSTALPPELTKAFDDEPLWIDLTRKGTPDATPERIRTAAARIFAKMRGRSLETVLGDELREARKARRIRDGAISVLCVLLVTAVVLGNLFRIERSNAIDQRDRAQSRQIAAEANQARQSDPALARWLSLTAYQASRTIEAKGQLLSSASMQSVTRVMDRQSRIFGMAVNNHSHLLATVGADGVLAVWDVGQPRHPRRLSQVSADITGLYSVDVSAGATMVAAGHDDGRITVWRLNSGGQLQEAATMRGHTRRVDALRFSPDGKMLASGGEDGVRLWNTSHLATASSGRLLPGGAVDVRSLAFSPDGGRLASGGSDGRARVWRVADPARPLVDGPGLRHPSGVTGVSFSPDGRILATACQDGKARLWDMARPGSFSVLAPSGTDVASALYAISFSQDGTRVAAGGQVGRLFVWSVVTGAPVASLPHPQPVQGTGFLATADEISTVDDDGFVRLWHLRGSILSGGQGRLSGALWSPAGGLVATGGEDGRVLLWNLSDPRSPSLIGPLPSRRESSVQRMAFSADGRRLAVPGGDGKVEIWDVTTPAAARLMGTVAAGGATVTSAAFSDDGRLLATGGIDRRAYLWNISNPSRPTLDASLPEHTGAIFSVTFSPDGKTLATAGGDGTAILYDVSDPGDPRMLGDPMGEPNGGSTLSVHFSNDGKTLITTGADGKAWLWDTSSLVHPVVHHDALSVGNTAIVDAGFGPGNLVATANADGTIWLWNAGPRKPVIVAKLVGHEDQVYSAQFDPSGRYLLSASLDSTAIIWDTDPDGLARTICEQVGDSISESEWSVNVPDRQRYDPCRASSS